CYDTIFQTEILLVPCVASSRRLWMFVYPGASPSSGLRHTRLLRYRLPDEDKLTVWKTVFP
ncbi:MAG: hypothetical protein II670_07370, partial [Alphaproteobacteria bacterium]|nr:hypothetical protein [Alphaproteobacteria bacterium]